MRTRYASVGLLPCFFFCGCMVGPKYVKPAPPPLPPAYKEASSPAPDSGWDIARPADNIPRGAWWTVFADPDLDALELQAATANQSVKASEARLRAARAQIRYDRAALAPTIRVAPFAGGERLSSNRPYPSTTPNASAADLVLPFDLSYEVDLWGRVRRSITASGEEAQATAADLQTALLSIQAEVALDYFELRCSDADKAILMDAVQQYEKALEVTRHRFERGLTNKADFEQAMAQLDAARVQERDAALRRAEYEHALAVLLGKAPAYFSIAVGAIRAKVPNVPTGLPSSLLERRPDIASDERRMAEANERIGIAQSAFYPTLSLSAASGLESTTASRFLNGSSYAWALGPTLSQMLFDNGRRRSVVEQAGARYEETVANYRQSVLTAFQQIEDNLAALRILEEEAVQQRHATEAAQNAEQIFNNRYVGGLDPYLQVIVAQTTALNDQRNDLDILRRQFEASVLLIKALGGGWSTADLPAIKAMSATIGKSTPNR